MVKIGPVDFEIICLKGIFERKKRLAVQLPILNFEVYTGPKFTIFYTM